MQHVYGSHTTGSSSLAAELHATAQQFVVSRPFPDLPPESDRGGSALLPLFDAFSQVRDFGVGAMREEEHAHFYLCAPS